MTYTDNQLSKFSLKSKNESLSFNGLINSIYSERLINYQIQAVNLKMKESNGKFYFVNLANIVVFEIGNYYLMDSVGNLTYKVKTIIESSDEEYNVNIMLDNEFLDDSNIVYPVYLKGRINYSLNNPTNVFRDKTIVKNTFEGLNCFGYSLRMLNEVLTIVSPTGEIKFDEIQMTEDYYYTMVIPSVLNTIKQQQYYSARILTSGYAPILSNEYRIALRVGNIANITKSSVVLPSNRNVTTNEDFHFMIQLYDGSWAHKQGKLTSRNFDIGEFPSNMDWNLYTDHSFEYIENFYDSSTVYFAISKSKFYGWT